jgi:hypothetical protein
MAVTRQLPINNIGMVFSLQSIAVIVGGCCGKWVAEDENSLATQKMWNVCFWMPLPGKK